MPISRLRTCPIGRCSPIAMPSGVTIQTTLLSSAATPIRNIPSGTAQNTAASGGPPEAQVTRPGTTISSTAPPEPAQTSLSLSEDPLRSRTSSGFAAAYIVSGKHHGRRGYVKRQNCPAVRREDQVLDQLAAFSSRPTVRSISSYWPSPACWNTTLPFWSTIYCAGQYWLRQAFQVCESLSWAT